MDRFVTVRVVQANGLDLSLFQFDYDLTFGVFFFNADRTLYGRYGTRSDKGEGSDKDISLESFRKAMEAVLELHAQFPASKAALAGKTGPASRFKAPEEFPSLQGKFKETVDFGGEPVRTCIHCHQVRDAQRDMVRKARQALPDELLYPWPMPDVLGLALDPQEKATVRKVTAGSQAEKDGFKPGDEILSLQGQPLISIADVQWVMHMAKEPAALQAVVRRGSDKVDLTLNLNRGWRRGSDISWRPTSWELRRMAFGGMLLEDMSPAARAKAGLKPDQLALHVKHVGQYGEHALAKKAGWLKDDIIVAVEGRSARLRETDLFAYIMQTKAPGTKLPAVVLRNGQRMNLELPSQ